MWLNIILAVIAGALFIWAFIRLFFHPTKHVEPAQQQPGQPQLQQPQLQQPQLQQQQLQQQQLIAGAPIRTSATAASDIVSPETQQTVKSISEINR